MNDSINKIEIIFDNNSGNVIINNNDIEECFVIESEEKKIKASDVYRVLGYSANKRYSVESNYDQVATDTAKDYMRSIISFFDALVRQINELTQEAMDDRIDGNDQ